MKYLLCFLVKYFAFVSHVNSVRKKKKKNCEVINKILKFKLKNINRNKVKGKFYLF